MKTRLTDHLHLLILAVGVALAAGGGARLGETDFEAAMRAGQAQTAESVPDAASNSGSVDSTARLTEWANANVGLFGSGIVLIVIGAALTRRRQGQQRQALGTEHASIDYVAELTNLVREVEQIRDMLAPQGADLLRVRQAIEDLKLNRLDPLFANRSALELQYGLSGYAAVMGPLAGAERFLNRTWTTLVDHHRGEAMASIALAVNAAIAARDAAAKLKAGSIS